MRVIRPHRGLTESLPRRLRWTRAHAPTRRRIPKLYRPEGRPIVRPSARVSLLHLLITLAVVAVIWAAGALFQTAYAGRIYPHVTIDHVPVGGMTRDEALAALRATETSRVNSPIYVQAADKSWQVTPAQFGARYDIASAVDRALALAHHGPFLIGGWTEASTIWNGANVPLSGTHNTAAVSRFLTRIAHEVHVAPTGAIVGVSGDNAVILRQPKAGRRLDIPLAASVLGVGVNTHDATAVTLPLQSVESALGYSAADAVLNRAHALLDGAPIRFLWTAGTNKYWDLPRASLAHLLIFTPRCAAGSCRFDLSLDVHKLADAFNRGGVAASVDLAPTPATYILVDATNPGAGVRVLADSPGIAIDVARNAQAILQGQRTIPVYTRPLYTNFNAADAEVLNFNRNVGASNVRFSGLDWARLDNLNIATNVISDTIVQPGHTFSVAAVAGPLTRRGGYMPGQNTVGSGDITGVNSGVDQLASAVLGAAYDAGLPIVRRTPYRYLNAFTLPGLDATVTYGMGKRGPDLVFRNTTDHAILVMTANDGAGGVGIYLYNSAGYAPGHLRVPDTYLSVTGTPRVTLNPDGSVDTTIDRSVSAAGHFTHDHLSSHYTPIDP